MRAVARASGLNTNPEWPPELRAFRLHAGEHIHLGYYTEEARSLAAPSFVSRASWVTKNVSHHVTVQTGASGRLQEEGLQAE